MARKQRPTPKTDAPEGRPLHWEDLDAQSKAQGRAMWANMGKVRSRAAAAAAGAEAKAASSSNPEYRKKQLAAATAVRTVEPRLKDKPMTLQGAARNRVRLMEAARQRAADEPQRYDEHTGWPVPRVAGGTGWYFGHHRDIAEGARQTGMDEDRAVTATTVMSPMNDPKKTELPAGRAMMDMVAGQGTHTVKLSDEVHRAASAKAVKLGGSPIPDSMRGRTVRLSQLSHHQIAAIGSLDASQREKGRPVESTADFGALGAARQSRAATKSIEHLRGGSEREDMIDPATSPKVFGYEKNTRESRPGSASHLEYLARALDYQRGGSDAARAGRQTPAGIAPGSGRTQAAALRMGLQPGLAATARLNQATGGRVADVRHLRHSEAGPLATNIDEETGQPRDTAEDTWQQAISSGQDLRSVNAEGDEGGRTSIAKTASSVEGLASEKDFKKTAPEHLPRGTQGPPSTVRSNTTGRVGGTAINHAMNNYATRQAATHLGLPATMVQEVPWTEGRRQANKDADYNNRDTADQSHLAAAYSAKVAAQHQRMAAGWADAERRHAGGERASLPTPNYGEGGHPETGAHLSAGQFGAPKPGRRRRAG